MGEMIGTNTLAGIIDEMENGVYDFTKDGKCIGCGSCCSNFLPMTKNEIKDIKRYIKKNNIRECRHFIPAVTVFDMTCPFLDISKPDKRCTIYEHRPMICRTFICNCPPSKADHGVLETMSKSHLVAVDMRETFFGGKDD